MEVALENPEQALVKDERLFGLKIFWEFVQDKSPFQPPPGKGALLFQTALAALKEILGSQRSVRVRPYFVTLCLSNLREGRSIYPSACLLMEMLSVQTQNFQKESTLISLID